MKPLKTMVWPLLFLAVGLGIAHYPMVFSGFRQMESGVYDARFFNYVLEHNWLWLTDTPHHVSLWSPPFYYPSENAGAYSEILLGLAPPYFLARWIGFQMDTAYQCWILALGFLNFGSMVAFARRALGVSWLASAVAGALFAFGGPRLSEASWGHYQVHAQVWSMLALLAFAIASNGGSEPRRRLAALLVGPCLALQLWSSVYMGWFLGLALPFAVLFALASSDVRAAAWARRRLLLPLLAGGAVAVLMLAPLAGAYTRAARSMGLRGFDEMLVPTWSRWLYLGDASVLYGSLAAHPLFAGIEGGQALGLGPLTGVLAVLGVWLGRRQRWLVVLAFGGLVLVALSTRFGDATAWQAVLEWVPGAGAIRAVTRVSLVVLIPTALAVAIALDRLREVFARTAQGAAVAAGIGLACLAEQAKYLPSFDKAGNRAAIHQIASQVDPKACDAFLYVVVGPTFHPWKYSIDAMWASLESGVPTINGYTGFHPEGWNLGTPTVVSSRDEDRMEADLARWVERNHLDATRVCQVRLRPRGETGREP